MEKKEEFLQEALKASILIPGSYEEWQLREIIFELPFFQSSLKYTLSQPKLHILFTRMIQFLLDKSIPFLASTYNLYFSILGMSKQQQEEFFQLFISHYTNTLLPHFDTADNSEYFDILHRIRSSDITAAEIEISKFILIQLQSIVKHKYERIQIYRYFLEMNYDMSGEDLTEALKDILRLNEYELFKEYVNAFQQSKFLNSKNNLYSPSVLEVACCSSPSLEIIKYLIETVGIDYHHFESDYVRLPIVQVVFHSNNNNHQSERYNQDVSSKIVKYFVELYKRDNRFDALYSITTNRILIANDIVKVAYETANIPVLLYLKQIGFHISERFQFLHAAVKSLNIAAVKLFWSDFKSSNPNFVAYEVSYSFLEIMHDAAMIESLEILNTFEENGFICSKFPELLAISRLELLPRYEFNDILYSNWLDTQTLYSTLLRELLTSPYFNLEYLNALFSCSPSFQTFYQLNYINTISSVLQNSQYNGYSVDEKWRVFKKFVSLPEFFPLVRNPCLLFWAKTFTNIPPHKHNSFSL